MLLVILLLSMFIVIPIEKKNPNESNNTLLPQISSVYYEDTTGLAHSVFVSGDYAYVADGLTGLAVIDISDPTNPGSPVYEDTAGNAFDVYVSGDYAYLADLTEGLAVINISNAANPAAPIYEDTTGLTRGVYVSGDYAYIADWLSDFTSINISDPTNPGLPVYEWANGNPEEIFVSGDYAYLASGYAGLAVIDISDPTDPGVPVYEDTAGSAYDVYVSGDYAYVADLNRGLAVINISNPTNPGAPVYADTSGYAYGVYVSGDYAYVAADTSGLAIIDISDPTNPGAPVYEDTSGNARGVYVSGDYAYVADFGSGLAVIDISELIDPVPAVYEDTTGYAHNIYVSGDYAYVADNTSGLAVIDISDPTTPGPPVYEDTTGNAYGVYVSGNYAYVADNTSGLAVINITNPTTPEPPVYEDTTGNAYSVYVSGNYAYVADGNSGLAVINITNPTNPEPPVYEDTAGNARSVYVSGNYAYVADGNSGLAVIDITHPTNPGPPVYEDTTGNAYGVYVSGNYAYVADNTSGLAVIDITDPTDPGPPVYEDTAGNARSVYVSGDYAFIADGDSGLVVIDISDPTDPGTPVYEDTTGYAYDVYVSGDYAYVVDDTSGLAIIQVRKRIDRENPIILNSPSDFTVEAGYTGEDISWTATDLNPNTYTIELIGTGLVVSSTPWANNTPVIYIIPDGFSVGSYIYIINFTDNYGHFTTDSISFTVEDTTNPDITVSPSNFTVEFGYTGQSISWTAIDLNPYNYSLELQGSGIVAGPTTWVNGSAINYNIPDGFSVGSYIYIINFTDNYENFIIDSANFTVVEDTTNPVITFSPNNFTVEYGYTGQSISWTSADTNPDTYTIELQGMGIVAGPTAWVNGSAINYNIPDGFSVGSYIYIINFTDNYENFITDSANFTVEDKTFPTIISASSNLTVEFGYTGQSLSWTATDLNPNTYTIELQGTGIVAGPSTWTSGVTITYNIADGFAVGVYVYTVNFTDDYNNFIIDSVTFTVDDTTNPTIISAPSDLSVESGYTGESISWTATDPYPNNYTIELQGTGIVAGPSTWTSGLTIIYNIADGFTTGVYVFTINFTDDSGNSITDSVTFTVADTTNPVITVSQTDLNLELGYTGEAISWTATDLNPNTYTIELQGTGIVTGPNAWTSGNTINYNLPDSFAVGVYTYSITFIDESGNSISDTVIVTILDATPEGGIPFSNLFLIFIGFSVICLIFVKKRQIARESR